MKTATAPRHLTADPNARFNEFKSSPAWKAKMALLDRIHSELAPRVDTMRPVCEGAEIDYQLD